MKLIDKDALTEHIKDTYCAGCDHWNYIRCRACETDDALCAIDAENEVDAIPIDWLTARMGEAEKAVYYCKGSAERNAEIMRSIVVVMELWKGEKNEAD